LIRSGRSVVEAARQFGRLATLCLTTYADVMDELDGAGTEMGVAHRLKPHQHWLS
jgi:hypothetical protein